MTQENQTKKKNLKWWLTGAAAVPSASFIKDSIDSYRNPIFLPENTKSMFPPDLKTLKSDLKLAKDNFQLLCKTPDIDPHIIQKLNTRMVDLAEQVALASKFKNRMRSVALSTPSNLIKAIGSPIRLVVSASNILKLLRKKLR